MASDDQAAMDASDARRRGVLWHQGKIVWQGHVDSDVRGILFDAVSLSTDDSARITARIGEHAMTADAMRWALADWWA